LVDLIVQFGHAAEDFSRPRRVRCTGRATISCASSLCEPAHVELAVALIQLIHLLDSSGFQQWRPW